jgi:hypothetical protein
MVPAKDDETFPRFGSCEAAPPDPAPPPAGPSIPAARSGRSHWWNRTPAIAA